MSGRLIHVSASKVYLCAMVRLLGASEVLAGWEGTNEEAVAAIMEDPREHIVLSGDCDRRGPDGRCLGHERS